MRRKPPLQPAWLALVASLILALLLWEANRAWRSLIEAEAWVKHTHEIQLATERLQSILLDAETSQRGFLVTGDKSYLAPYLPSDTPVQVEVRGRSGDPVLSIHNMGESIPPELRSRLFEPMQRGSFREERSSRSIGLGLFIVKHVVMAHGGHVDVESSAEEGTTFLVRLPRA